VTSDTSCSAATASPRSISLMTSAVTMSSGMRSGARKAQMPISVSAAGQVPAAFSIASSKVANTGVSSA
jgi:hypothetical protein